jgi:hypothetical protein
LDREDPVCTCGRIASQGDRYCAACGQPLGAERSPGLDAFKALALGSGLLGAGELTFAGYRIAVGLSGWGLEALTALAYGLVGYGWWAWSQDMPVAIWRGGRGRRSLRRLAIGYTVLAVVLLLDVIRVATTLHARAAIIAGWLLYAIGGVATAAGFRLWATAAKTVA